MFVSTPILEGRAQRGFSLVELMVAMALSLILLAGVLAIFASSRTTYETTDRLSRLQENGRFALDMIVRDLRGAGFNGCTKRAAFSSSLNPSVSVLWDFSRPVDGFDAQGGGWAPEFPEGAAAEAEPVGDALVIRGPRGEFEPIRLLASMGTGADPVEIADTSPPLIKANDVVQVSDCRSRHVFQVTANSSGVLAHDVSAATAIAPGNARADMDGVAFLEDGELVPMRSVVYFLREGSTPDAGTSLWRGVSGATAPEELVEGVERMQFQYGEDTNGDTVISVNEYRNADEVEDWNGVLSVRIALLVRSLSAYGTDVDDGTYVMLEETVEDPGDRHLRQVFSTTVNIRNSST